MDTVMNHLWDEITSAQTSGLAQFNNAHGGIAIRVNMNRTGWYEGYY